MFHHRDAGVANRAANANSMVRPWSRRRRAERERGYAPLRARARVRRLLIEVNAEAHEIADACRAFGAEHFDGAGITQASPGAQGVAICSSTRRQRTWLRNAALGEAGVAVFQARLGDQGDGVLAAEFECSDEPGDACQQR